MQTENTINRRFWLQLLSSLILSGFLICTSEAGTEQVRTPERQRPQSSEQNSCEGGVLSEAPDTLATLNARLPAEFAITEADKFTIEDAREASGYMADLLAPRVFARAIFTAFRIGLKIPHNQVLNAVALFPTAGTEARLEAGLKIIAYYDSHLVTPLKSWDNFVDQQGHLTELGITDPKNFTVIARIWSAARKEKKEVIVAEFIAKQLDAIANQSQAADNPFTWVEWHACAEELQKLVDSPEPISEIFTDTPSIPAPEPQMNPITETLRQPPPPARIPWWGFWRRFRQFASRLPKQKVLASPGVAVPSTVSAMVNQIITNDASPKPSSFLPRLFTAVPPEPKQAYREFANIQEEIAFLEQEIGFNISRTIYLRDMTKSEGQINLKADGEIRQVWHEVDEREHAGMGRTGVPLSRYVTRLNKILGDASPYLSPTEFIDLVGLTMIAGTSSAYAYWSEPTQSALLTLLEGIWAASQNVWFDNQAQIDQVIDKLRSYYNRDQFSQDDRKKIKEIVYNRRWGARKPLAPTASPLMTDPKVLEYQADLAKVETQLPILENYLALLKKRAEAAARNPQPAPTPDPEK